MKYWKHLGINNEPIGFMRTGKETLCVSDWGVSYRPAVWDFSDDPDIVPATEAEFKKATEKTMSKLSKLFSL